MVELSKQLLSWIAGLLPTQKVRGDQAMQIGRVHGRVHVDRSTHHHTQHNNHVTIIQAPCVEPVRAGQVVQPAVHPVADAKPHGLISSADCAAVLRRMEKLRDRTRVLDFMVREFGTRMVNQLTPDQHYRLSRYLDAVLQDRRNLKARRRQ